MKLFAIILFALSVVLLIIGIHQVMVNGFANSYWIFMFSLTFFFGYGYVKNYHIKQDDLLVNSKHAETITQKKGKKKGKI